MEVVDELWFDRLHAISDRVGETYELLLPSVDTLDIKLRDFELSDYKKNVSLYADRADVYVLQSAREELAQIKQDVANDEPNELVRDTYLESIERIDANAAVMIAGTIGDNTLFTQTNNRLYERPDNNVFKAVCHWIRHDTEKTLQSSSKRLRELGEDVLTIIPDLHDNHQMLIPTESLFHSVREAHRKPGGYYDTLFGIEGMPKEPFIDHTLGDEICQRMLSNIGSDFTMAPSDTNIWAVFPSRKEIVRPDGYRLDRDEFTGIVCHEIGSHVLEYEYGRRQPLKLLSIGLAGYEKTDEGRAFLREQIIYENERTFLQQFAWEYIALLHLSVSLASGSHGKPYDFAQLYRTLYTLYLFWRERRAPLSTNNVAFARNEAWQLAVRVMKGTDGTGGAYMKDSIYLEGNIKCWQLAEADPSIIFTGDLGKLDISNQKHMAIVRSLKLTQ